MEEQTVTTPEPKMVYVYEERCKELEAKCKELEATLAERERVLVRLNAANDRANEFQQAVLDILVGPLSTALFQSSSFRDNLDSFVSDAISDALNSREFEENVNDAIRNCSFEVTVR